MADAASAAGTDDQSPDLNVSCCRNSAAADQRSSQTHRDSDDPLLGQRTQSQTVHGGGEEHHEWPDAGNLPLEIIITGSKNGDKKWKSV